MPEKREAPAKKQTCPNCHKNDAVRTFPDGSNECLRCRVGF